MYSHRSKSNSLLEVLQVGFVLIFQNKHNKIIGGSKGAPGTPPPHLSPISFILCSFGFATDKKFFFSLSLSVNRRIRNSVTLRHNWVTSVSNDCEYSVRWVRWLYTLTLGWPLSFGETTWNILNEFPGRYFLPFQQKVKYCQNYAQYSHQISEMQYNKLIHFKLCEILPTFWFFRHATPFLSCITSLNTRNAI